MNLKLEALSPTDGIGIIRSGQTLRLLRPPYVSSDACVLPEDSLQDAILRHGFSASDEEFQSWEDAIAFLDRQVVAARRSLGKDIPSAILSKDILDVAPAGVLDAFLDRVEREVIPQRLFDHAEDFLLALLSTSGGRSPELAARAVRLLQLNKDARKMADSGISELANRDVRFSSLEQRRDVLQWSLRMTEDIRKRGCVFAPA